MDDDNRTNSFSSRSNSRQFFFKIQQPNRPMRLGTYYAQPMTASRRILSQNAKPTATATAKPQQQRQTTAAAVAYQLIHTTSNGRAATKQQQRRRTRKQQQRQRRSNQRPTDRGFLRSANQRRDVFLVQFHRSQLETVSPRSRNRQDAPRGCRRTQ